MAAADGIACSETAAQRFIILNIHTLAYASRTYAYVNCIIILLNKCKWFDGEEREG